MTIEEDAIEKFTRQFEELGDPVEYVPPKPIKLNKKVRQFCNTMNKVNLEWSGCGQFWAEMKPNELEKMLSTLHSGELLYIKEKDSSRIFYAERFGRKVTVSNRSPFN